MKKHESPRECIPLIDSGRWHENLVKPDRITVFLPSDNGPRAKAVAETLDILGIPITVRQVRGPNPEIGDTTLHRSAYKTQATVEELVNHGYFDRHPADTTIVVASDSRDIWHGRYRDKPSDIEAFMTFGEEWERAAMGEGLIVSEAAYAAMVIHGTQARIVTIADKLSLHPLSRSVVQTVFRPDRFPNQRNFAHGFGAKLQITQGNLAVVALSGEQLFGNEAIHRVYAASTDHFSTILQRSLEISREIS